MMFWLDSHTHINDPIFNDDIDDVLLRMEENMVKKAMIVCLNEQDFLRALDLKKRNANFDIALGIYPGDVKNFDFKTIERMFELMQRPEVTAIGEIGLDYHWDSDNKPEQQAMFIKQIDLAKSMNKAIIVHSRSAIQDTYDILKAHPIKGVMHCYSDSKEMAKELLKIGMYISLSGTVTFKNAKEPKEVAKIVPLDRLLIETDAPYLAPVPYRGKRNEPAFVRATGEFIAELLNIDELVLMENINQNYERLFHNM